MASEDLLKLLKQQIDQQRSMMEAQEKGHREQLDVMMQLLRKPGRNEQVTPITACVFSKFSAFDSGTELWTDYWARFNTFVEANSVPEEKKAYVFLTNQSPVTHKLLTNLASQQSPPEDVNEFGITSIAEYMMEQFHPKRFIVRERFKFWSKIKRKPGGTIQELVSRIRQDAVACDFPSIKDPLDEAMRTRFICSINNEAVLRAIFKVKDDQLTFAKAIEVAIEIEDAVKVAKETVHGQTSTYEINQVQSKKKA